MRNYTSLLCAVLIMMGGLVALAAAQDKPAPDKSPSRFTIWKTIEEFTDSEGVRHVWRARDVRPGVGRFRQLDTQIREYPDTSLDAQHVAHMRFEFDCQKKLRRNVSITLESGRVVRSQDDGWYEIIIKTSAPSDTFEAFSPASMFLRHACRDLSKDPK